MELIFDITFAVTLFYALLLLWVVMKYEVARTFKHDNVVNGVLASIIIPARNEEQTIENCLAGIARQDYSNYEVLVIDDDSTDRTPEVVIRFKDQHPAFPLTLIKLKDNLQKKKGALLCGIERAKGELIITRDADTLNSSENWLSAVVAFYLKEKPAMIICPVTLKTGTSFRDAFQLTEHMFLQLFTSASALSGFPYLCNGANLCFTKRHFEEVGGYGGNMEIASGDDIFLLEKFKREKLKISYLKSTDAAVNTFSLRTWIAILHQKSRWAGKLKQHLNLQSAISGILVFLTNFLLLLCFVLSFFFEGSYKTFAASLLIKWIIDFLLLTLSSWRQKSFIWMPWFLFLELFNHIYLLLIPVVTLAITPVWKGRYTE